MLWKWTVLIATAAIVSAGCGEKAGEEVAESLMEKAIEKESGEKAKVEISEGSFSMKMEGGDMLTASEDGVEIPEGFPEDVLVYEGSKALASLMMGGNFQVTLQSKDPRAKVVETYKEKMEAEGWEQGMAMAMGEGDMLQYKKGERSVMVTVAEDDGKTMISLSVQEKK